MKTIYLTIVFVFLSILSFAQPPLQNQIVVRFATNPGYTPDIQCTAPLKVCLNLCWSTVNPDPTCSMGTCQQFCDNSVGYNEMLSAIINPGISGSTVTVCVAELEITTSYGFIWRHSIKDADWPLNTWMVFEDELGLCCYQVHYGIVSGVRTYTIWPRAC